MQDKPHSNKKDAVKEMFDSIAPRYDFLNHLLSLGIDKRWRKKLRRKMAKQQPETILDIATGTGDLAFELTNLNPKSIIGIDISDRMLEIAKIKAKKKKLTNIVSFHTVDGADMPYSDNSFNAASIAFGIRNFEDPRKGLNEIYRVLKPDGMVYILEFGMPDKQPVKGLYSFYFLKVSPFLGRLFSGNRKAYKYLPESVNKFFYGNDFIDFMKSLGFKDVSLIKLSSGIAYIYIGAK